MVPACSYYLEVQDAMLGFIGGVSMIFFYTVFATAPEPWVLYIGEAGGNTRSLFVSILVLVFFVSVTMSYPQLLCCLCAALFPW